uniref:Uncharacterized protein n=1 Tax=viral metagenome TaxID=1070528 RepID=A0A6C0LXZ3_9ZZZZ
MPPKKGAPLTAIQKKERDLLDKKRKKLHAAQATKRKHDVVSLIKKKAERPKTEKQTEVLPASMSAEDEELAALIEAEVESDVLNVAALKRAAIEHNERRERQRKTWQSGERAPSELHIPSGDPIGMAKYESVREGKRVTITRPIYSTPIYPFIPTVDVMKAFRSQKSKQRELLKSLAAMPEPKEKRSAEQIQEARMARQFEELQELDVMKPEKTEFQQQKERKRDEERELELSIMEEHRARQLREAEIEEEEEVPEAVLTEEAAKELDRRAEDIADVEEEEEDDEQTVPEGYISEDEEDEEDIAPPIEKTKVVPVAIREPEFTKFKEVTAKRGKFTYTGWERLERPEVEYKTVADVDVEYKGVYTFVMGSGNIEIPWKRTDRRIIVVDSTAIRHRDPFVGGAYLKPITSIYIARKRGVPQRVPPTEPSTDVMTSAYTDIVPSASDLLEEPVTMEARNYVMDYMRSTMKSLVIGTVRKSTGTMVERRATAERKHLSFDEYRTLHLNRFRAFEYREMLRNDGDFLEELDDKIDTALGRTADDMANDYINTIRRRFGSIVANEQDLLKRFRSVNPTLFDIVAIELLADRELYRNMKTARKPLPEIPDITTTEGKTNAALHYFRVKYNQATEEELREQLKRIKNVKYSSGKRMYKLTQLETDLLKFLNDRQLGKVSYAKGLKGDDLVVAIRKFIRHNIVKGTETRTAKNKSTPLIPQMEIDAGHAMIVRMHDAEMAFVGALSLKSKTYTYDEILHIIRDHIVRYITDHPVAFMWYENANDVKNAIVLAAISKRMAKTPTQEEIDEFNSAETFEYERTTANDVPVTNVLYGGDGIAERYAEYEKSYQAAPSEILTLKEFEAIQLEKHMYNMYLSKTKPPMTNTQAENKKLMREWLEAHPSDRDAWELAFSQIELDGVDEEYRMFSQYVDDMKKSDDEWPIDDISQYEEALFERHGLSTRDYLNESSLHVAILSRDPAFESGLRRGAKIPGAIVRESIISGHRKLKDLVGMTVESMFMEIFMNRELMAEDVHEIKMHLAGVGMVLTHRSIAYIAASLYPTSRIRITEVFPMILPDETLDIVLYRGVGSYAVNPQTTCYPNRPDIGDGELVLVKDEVNNIHNCFSYKQLFYLIKRAGNEPVMNPFRNRTSLPQKLVDDIKTRYTKEIQDADISSDVIDYVVKWDKDHVRVIGPMSMETGERLGTWKWYDIAGTLVREHIHHPMMNGVVRVTVKEY